MGQTSLAGPLVVPLERELAQKLAAMETNYDAQFKVVFDAIRELMAPPPVPPRPRIGFTRPKAELAATASR